MRETEQLILVVDDEEMTMKLIAQAIELIGYRVNTALNGLQAMQAITEEKPDMVITDIHMPEMNGIELLREIRKTDQRIPVVMITGYDVGEAHDAVEKYHGNGIVTKPFRINRLKEVIEKNLQIN